MRLKPEQSFAAGLRAGLPIGLGYLSVAFAFGIFAVQAGLSPWEALLISCCNVTSAGQLAAVPVLAGGGTLPELALAQLVINLRYALMGVSLSQKLGNDVRTADRFAIAFVNTDEVFAVASAQEGRLSRRYLYGLECLPYIGWAVGTILGALTGDLLPSALLAALGIAIYAMFVAIVVPAAKNSLPVALCALGAALLRTAFTLLPGLRDVPAGFAVILCSVPAAAVAAWLAPETGKETGA